MRLNYRYDIILDIKVASMLNITSLERHITLDRSMYGSDQAASLELKGMIELHKQKFKKK